MNDPKAVELLQMALKAHACSERIAPYVAKAAAGNLTMADLQSKDAVWMLAVVKPSNVVGLKSIAKAK